MDQDMDMTNITPVNEEKKESTGKGEGEVERVKSSVDCTKTLDFIIITFLS